MNGEHDFMSKEAVDDYDHRVREGLGILQVMVMQQCPNVSNSFWSSVLRKQNQSVRSTEGIIDYILAPLNK